MIEDYKDIRPAARKIATKNLMKKLGPRGRRCLTESERKDSQTRENSQQEDEVWQEAT